MAGEGCGGVHVDGAAFGRFYAVFGTVTFGVERSEERLDAIINAGVAGGMNTKVKVCDIVVSDVVCPHDLELRFLENYPPYHSMYEADKQLIDTVCES